MMVAGAEARCCSGGSFADAMVAGAFTNGGRAQAVVAERGCKGAREVRCIAVAAAVRTKKMPLRRLLLCERRRCRCGSCLMARVHRREGAGSWLLVRTVPIAVVEGISVGDGVKLLQVVGASRWPARRWRRRLPW